MGSLNVLVKLDQKGKAFCALLNKDTIPGGSFATDIADMSLVYGTWLMREGHESFAACPYDQEWPEDKLQALRDSVMRRTAEKYPPRLKEILPEIYVLTNSTGILGSTAILYPSVGASLHETLGDYYVLPGSIHEIIIVKKDSCYSLMDLKKTVGDTNDILGPETFLSSHVFEYFPKEDRLFIAA